MTQYSHPWSSVEGDRPITSAQAAAMNAALASDGVLVGFTGSTTSPNLTVTQGAAIIKGVYFDTGGSIALSLSSVNGTTAKLVARYDLAARSITLKVIEGALVQSGGTWDLLLATLTYAGGSWSQPLWAYTWSQAATRTAAGVKSFSVAGVPVDTNIGVDVAFPAGLFAAPPVVVTAWGGYFDTSAGYSEERPININSGDVTINGFRAIYKKDASGNQDYKAFNWIAVGH